MSESAKIEDPFGYNKEVEEASKPKPTKMGFDFPALLTGLASLTAVIIVIAAGFDWGTLFLYIVLLVIWGIAGLAITLQQWRKKKKSGAWIAASVFTLGSALFVYLVVR